MDKCNSVGGIESTDRGGFPATFIINTYEKDKLLSVENNGFLLSKINNGSYCETYTIDFYLVNAKLFKVTYCNQDVWINNIPIDKVSKHLRKMYDARGKPYFQVFYKCYSFFVDYEKSISMDILTDIVYEYKNKYPLNFNILTLYSPTKWKNLNHYQNHLKKFVYLNSPTFSEYNWLEYFKKNIS